MIIIRSRNANLWQLAPQPLPAHKARAETAGLQSHRGLAVQPESLHRQL